MNRQVVFIQGGGEGGYGENDVMWLWRAGVNWLGWSRRKE